MSRLPEYEAAPGALVRRPIIAGILTFYDRIWAGIRPGPAAVSP